jgi:hypothetical protein
LIAEFQNWGKRDIELSVEQIGKTLTAVREKAIPQIKNLVASEWLAESRQEVQGMLGDWETFERIFSAALNKNV